MKQDWTDEQLGEIQNVVYDVVLPLTERIIEHSFRYVTNGHHWAQAAARAASEKLAGDPASMIDYLRRCQTVAENARQQYTETLNRLQQLPPNTA